MLANDGARLGSLLFNEARTRANHHSRQGPGCEATQRAPPLDLLVVVMTAKRSKPWKPERSRQPYSKAR